MEHLFFRGLPLGAFDLAMIDFPWPWETWADSGRSKTPGYDTMTLREIEQTRPQDLLSPTGCALFWCTWPLIAKQSRIIEDVFGLEIKTGGAWSKRGVNGKLRWGPGHIIRTVCEPYLITARKGHGLRGRNWKNLLETFSDSELPGLARENSRKPDEFYAELERLTPGWVRADVFSRQSRPGWTIWGREKTKFDNQKKR